MSRNISALSAKQGELADNLFENIVEQKAATGTAETEKLKGIAEDYLIGEAPVLGAVSFYDFLKKETANKKVFVCNGTACLVAQTQDELTNHLRSHFKDEEIGEMCCLGRCHENGSFQYGGVNYSAKTDDEIDLIITSSNGVNGMDSYRVSSNLEDPILAADFLGIGTYYTLMKDILKRTPEELIEEITVSNVRGRGGAGFPAGIKWKTCSDAPGTPKYIVCNADEGDPGAYTDRYIMEQQPHLLLFGMIVAGYVVGSEVGIIYIRGEYPESVDAINQAVADLQDTEYLGQNICGTDFNFQFKVIKGQGAYICGEETALLASIEGQRPEVRVRPPFPAIEGLYRKPTVVNNVETFAFVHRILLNGGEEFSKIGTKRSTGTKLVSMDSNFNTPGCYEIEMGTPLSTVISEFGGGFKIPVKAVHIGGPLGGLVPVHKIGNLTLDFESFRDNGFLLGHASIIAIPENFPMIEYIEHLFKFTAEESCGKCFPCRMGSVRGQEMMEKARTSDYRIDRELLTDLVETMELTSLCALGGGVPLPIRNTLEYF